VAELIIGLIVALARKLGDVSMKMHNGTWFKSADNCHEVRGKTVGIIGYGHVGSQVSVLAESMGMKVLFYDVVPKMPLGSAVSCHTVDDVLRQADFVTLHVPETDTTKNMIGAAQLASMRKGSYLLNYSRGTVVDLDALAAALKSGHLHGAAVDVYPEEPKTKQAPFVTPLMGCPNTILTPHIGGSTEEAQALIGYRGRQQRRRGRAQGRRRARHQHPHADPLLGDVPVPSGWGIAPTIHPTARCSRGGRRRAADRPVPAAGRASRPGRL
jgi:D-3-phosphoglycerate dehydrogenase